MRNKDGKLIRRRYIDGVLFLPLYGPFGNKNSAQTAAKWARKKGEKCRVIYRKSHEKYYVYVAMPLQKGK